MKKTRKAAEKMTDERLMANLEIAQDEKDAFSRMVKREPSETERGRIWGRISKVETDLSAFAAEAKARKINW